MVNADGRDRANVAGWTDELVGTVFPAEYETIMARRREVARRSAGPEGGLPAEPPDRAAGALPVPSTKLRLFGLAFSGGGIRSATFNLGVTQALAKHGLLPRFDYLSTVSGGGYIGSCLSALLNRPEADSRWTSAFPFYLESGRQEPVALRHLRNNSKFLLSTASAGSFGMAAVLLRGMLVNILAMMPFVVIAVALTHWTYGERLAGGLRRGLHDYALTAGALAAFALAVGAFPLLAWLGHQRASAAELATRSRAGAAYGLLLKLVLGLALLESLPLVLRWYHQRSEGGTILQSLTWLSVLGTVIPAASPGDAASGATRRKVIDALTLLAAAAAGPLVLLSAYVVLAEWVVFPGTAPMDDAIAPHVIYGSGAAVLGYVLLFLDANATSIHQYYRDRLSAAYLFQVDPAGAGSVRSADRMRMTELNAAGTVAPYHLLNTTINLQGSHDVSLRGRAGDFFVISKHHVGSVSTGYCATSAMEAADPRLDLGTALAISGAAAAPNMGTATIRPLALLMTLLNLRMSYWLIHPKHARATGGALLGRLGVGLGQLLVEATSRPNEHRRHVNVSDGAHIENLGVYELLRRRCRVIVCGDGEADPFMAFNGLATVIRCAATDMGVHIDIDLGGLALDSQGRSKQHHAIGRIDYGDGEVGWLLYIKLSIGERELPYIEQYRHANPEFPHQSTADQFFDAAQFEAYRALGFKVGLRTMQALTALVKEAGDDELFDFSGPGGEPVPKHDEPHDRDPLEGGLRQSFQSAADPEPPW